MTQKIIDELGARIRDIRIEKNLTQQQLAEKSELSLPFINLIENNKRRISLETLVKLLDSLDIPLSDFFLPYSQNDDKELAELLMLLQLSDNKAEYISLFTNLLKLANNSSDSDQKKGRINL